MSSFDHPIAASATAGPRAWRRWLAGALVVGLSSLAGCGDGGGFRPMYAASASGTRVDEKLAQIEIVPIGGKTGQRIRNELIFLTTGGAAAIKPVYRLQITVTELLGATLVKTTGNSYSSSYNLDATFTLYDIQSKRQLLTGTSQARASFDRFLSIYSNVRAADDAAERASKTVAEELRGRLAAFLSADRV